MVFSELFLEMIAVGLADVVVVEGGGDFAFCLVLAFDELVEEVDEFRWGGKFAQAVLFSLGGGSWLAMRW